MTAIGVEEQLEFPAEDFDLSRFGARWRLIGFGLFDVWKYTMLDLRAPSGRLLLRGPNGTGRRLRWKPSGPTSWTWTETRCARVTPARPA